MPITFLTQKELNTIRGKAMAGHATPKEIISVFSHCDLLESKLEEADYEDFFGTERWRRYFGLPEEN